MESNTISYVPQLGMEFETVEDAWVFWMNYGGRTGFGVRKGKGHMSTKGDGLYTSYIFVCNCEGTRGIDKRDHLTKTPRAETRTNCQVRLQIKLDRRANRFKVVKFDSEHNHPLHKAEACYLIPTQRKVSEVACVDIHLADSSGIGPKDAHELLSKQAGGLRNVGYTIIDHKNCLRDIRKHAMEYGAAIAITKYFERRSFENPSFQHFEDTTENQEIANILWADAKMIVAYAQFGDVVVFDTTFGTNKEKWAFGVFVGFNHFREITIFGAALMCNQTTESFEWVFSKFLEAHGGKRPITIFTDQDSAMGVALEKIMPGTKHGLCAWHISQNCQKHLMRYNKDGLNITGEFLACVYTIEEEMHFEIAFKELMDKLDDKYWLKFIYGCKEKWAYCYMKHAYTLGIRSTQSSESINSTLKNYLHCKLDVSRFLEHFDRVLATKREKEVIADYEMSRKKPRLKLDVPILREAGNIYTPKIFELFQSEFELSGSAQIEKLDGNTYTVGMCNINNDERLHKSRQVVWDRDTKSISCSCKKFEREGILCWHALKVLDREDIKVIPPSYILKRWTQEAKAGSVVDSEGRTVIEDAMLHVRNQKAYMIRGIQKTCDKAAYNEEETEFVINALHDVTTRYEELYGNQHKENSGDGTNQTISSSENSLRLKKKKTGDNRTKRKHPWNEKLARTRKNKVQKGSNSQPSLR